MFNNYINGSTHMQNSIPSIVYRCTFYYLCVTSAIIHRPITVCGFRMVNKNKIY